MWLLSTDRAELHHFARSFDVIGGYAILSHTWDGDGEHTLQEVRAIIERCRKAGTNPRDDPALSSKIRECCILAEKHGYRWLWIDSCCIDKTSSSELSEAINSMYRWYKEAEVCFAYLADVPDGDDLHAKGSAFRKSRWHMRGWTLQELISPDFVIFLSTDWHKLGNRAELAELLEEITRVPSGILKGVEKPAQWSACKRMSWASERRTTRVEDEAYCLMGLFGVSMPTNYGEGKRAFIRLQYEIMQHQECDMSLFAFGYCVNQDDIAARGLVLDNHSEDIDRDNSWRYLLADSPRDFRNTFGYIPDLGPNAIREYPPPDSTNTGPFHDIELPHATPTSYGVHFRLPVATIDGITVAVMLCEAGDRHFGLFLTRDSRGKDRKRPRYFVGCNYVESAGGESGASYVARMCDLGDDLYNPIFNGKSVTASWCDIYIVPTASHFVSDNMISPTLPSNCNPASRIHVPRWLVSRFIALQFDVREVAHDDSDTLRIIGFIHRSEGIGCIFVCLGACTAYRDPDTPPHLWAKVLVTTRRVIKSVHNCFEDHLDSESWAGWPTGTCSKAFGDENHKVQLSFRGRASARASETTPIEIHLELSGTAFEDLLRLAGISLPSLADVERDSARPTPDAAPIILSQLRSPSDHIDSTANPISSSWISTTVLHPLRSRIIRPLRLPIRVRDACSQESIQESRGPLPVLRRALAAFKLRGHRENSKDACRDDEPPVQKSATDTEGMAIMEQALAEQAGDGPASGK